MRAYVVDKGTHSEPGERRGLIIRGTRFGIPRADAKTIKLPVIDCEGGWYHAAAIRAAEAVADVLPFPSKPH